MLRIALHGRGVLIRVLPVFKLPAISGRIPSSRSSASRWRLSVGMLVFPTAPAARPSVPLWPGIRCEAGHTPSAGAFWGANLG